MKTQVQQGDALYVTAPAGGMTSGNGYTFSHVFGISAYTCPVGATGVIYIRGVFTINKNAPDNFAMGDLVYWDNTNFRTTSTSTSNRAVGVAAAAAGASTTTVQIVLLPTPV